MSNYCRFFLLLFLYAVDFYKLVNLFRNEIQEKLDKGNRKNQGKYNFEN